jgi:hypothetical protein
MLFLLKLIVLYHLKGSDIFSWNEQTKRNKNIFTPLIIHSLYCENNAVRADLWHKKVPEENPPTQFIAKKRFIFL